MPKASLLASRISPIDWPALVKRLQWYLACLWYAASAAAFVYSLGLPD